MLITLNSYIRKNTTNTEKGSLLLEMNKYFEIHLSINKYKVQSTYW